MKEWRNGSRKICDTILIEFFNSVNFCCFVEAVTFLLWKIGLSRVSLQFRKLGLHSSVIASLKTAVFHDINHIMIQIYIMKYLQINLNNLLVHNCVYKHKHGQIPSKLNKPTTKNIFIYTNDRILNSMHVSWWFRLKRLLNCKISQKLFACLRKRWFCWWEWWCLLLLGDLCFLSRHTWSAKNKVVHHFEKAIIIHQQTWLYHVS